MSKAKIDNSIFIKAKIGLIFDVIFELPQRIFFIVVMFAITTFGAVFLSYIFYFILEVIVNIFIDFRLEGESQWIAITGISCWIGAYFGLTDYKKTEKESLVRGVTSMFDFSKYSITYNKINAGIISKKLDGQLHFQDINLTLKVPEFWKSEKPIKISDLKKSKDIEVLGEKPQGWLALKYKTYKFVAKYGKEEKKLKAVQVFSRKEESFVDSLGTENETKALLEYMFTKEYRILYIPTVIPQKESSINLFKKKYKKEKDFEKKKRDYFLFSPNNDQLYNHINNYFNFTSAKEHNEIRISYFKRYGELVEQLKDEIVKDYDSFFVCLEKVGNTFVRHQRE